MKLSTLKLSGFLILLAAISFSCSTEEKKVEKYPYQEVTDDPLQTRIYKLKNGLTVYLSLNRDEPRVQTNIAVRAGSKYDPAETTGLAHYLEHMLFKGNSRIASLDWESEKVLLKEVSNLYELHRATEVQEEKDAIYSKIDSISQVAASYVVPNEYDKMISSLGAKGTNAYTSDERTVYINDIPSNALEKWMMLESARFSELTLRLFHTELEAVYEEFNRAQDNDYFKEYKAVLQQLFPKHQYGTQTTIGEGEHLKNPSMEKINEYFDTYYVPNNMAIVLAGDLDYDATIEMIDKHFGSWEPKDLPSYTPPKEDPLNEVKTTEVFGPNSERVSLAYRLGGSDSKDAMYLKLIDGLLSNGKAGLIDINLKQKQEVLDAYSYPGIMKDYSYLFLNATPKEGQSLDEAKELLIAQIDLIKKGEFEDWLPGAVVNFFKLSETRRADNNSYRARMLTDAFILEQDWADYIHTNEDLEKIKKDELVAFAKEHFNDNYVVVYKRSGTDSTTYKVNKPAITPVQINRDNQSEFAQRFDSMQEQRLDPVFLDYENDLHMAEFAPGIEYYAIKNETNGLFSLSYILEMGKNNDLDMAFAVEYLKFLGTSEHNVEALTKEFFKLGVDYDVYTAEDRMYVTLSGLNESLEPGLELFEKLLADAQPNDEALGKLVNNKLKERADNKKEKYYIHRGAMLNYGMYGPTNPFKNILSESELKATKASDLVSNIQQLTDYEHLVFYYGPDAPADAMNKIKKFHTTPESPMACPAEKPFKELDNTENLVYFVNYDMVQTELLMISKSQPFNKEILPYANIFNEYFGAGLSSIIFQEIRESKALAYAAYAYYDTPSKKSESHYLQAYIGTQTNKLGQASGAIIELLNEMPEAKGQFEDSRLAALKKIETDRITKQSIFWNYFFAKRRGLNEDVRKMNYEVIKTMKMDDLKGFFNNNIRGNKFTYLVIGNRSEVDFKALNKFGKVKELTLEEVFGY